MHCTFPLSTRFLNPPPPPPTKDSQIRGSHQHQHIAKLPPVREEARLLHALHPVPHMLVLLCPDSLTGVRSLVVASAAAEGCNINHSNPMMMVRIPDMRLRCVRQRLSGQERIRDHRAEYTRKKAIVYKYTHVLCVHTIQGASKA